MPGPKLGGAGLRFRAAGALLLVLAAGVLSGCGASGASDSGRGGAEGNAAAALESGDWVNFGPFLKPAIFVDAVALPGPIDLFVSEQGIVRLDAMQLLPGEIVENEFYTFTYDEQRPLVGAIIQTRVPAQADEPERWITSVSAVAVDGRGVTAEIGEGSGSADAATLEVSSQPGTVKAEMLTRIRTFDGAPHRAELMGISGLGVVAVQMTGDLNPDLQLQRRLTGVDVARGTPVWIRNNGFAVYGEGVLTYLTAVSADACAERIEEVDVANGNTLRSWTAEEYAAETGKSCLRADAR